MKTSFLCLLASLIALTLHAQEQTSGPSLLPLNDNTAPPHMGLYEGVPKNGGISQVDEYATWLNRTLMWGHGSEGWENWNSVENPHWLLAPWSAWVAAMPGRRVVFSVPLIPYAPKGQPAYTLKEAAAGAYNEHFIKLGKSLVENKLENSIIRLGWEFDGGWYPWKTLTPEDAANEAQAFHQVVTTMRAIPGLEKLEFCWNSAMVNTKYETEAAYPGDDVVNYVGIDIYDKTWTKGIYPYPDGATPEQRQEIQKKAWLDIYSARHGIKDWIAFAKKHQKPLMIPEWGLWSDAKGHRAGYDNPYFVQQMYNLIQDPANNVYEAAYWDSREAKVIPTGGTTSQYPDSAALFQKLFSLPPSAANPAPPAPAATTNAPAPAAMN